MTPWYEESFGRDYLMLYTQRDISEARANVRSSLELLSLQRDTPVLDLCCGAGRHLLALREMGFERLVGLDLSNELLQVAANRLAGEGDSSHHHIPLIRADMRAIPCENHFAAVVSFFTSFGYFEADAENQAVLASVHNALRPGGFFLMDYINREHVISHLVPSDERTLPNGCVQNVRYLTADCRRVEKTSTVITGANERQFHESVRLYSQAEMLERFQAAGFVDVRSYGSLDGQGFGPESNRLRLAGKTSARE